MNSDRQHIPIQWGENRHKSLRVRLLAEVRTPISAADSHLVKDKRVSSHFLHFLSFLAFPPPGGEQMRHVGRRSGESGTISLDIRGNFSLSVSRSAIPGRAKTAARLFMGCLMIHAASRSSAPSPGAPFNSKMMREVLPCLRLNANGVKPSTPMG